MKVDVETYMAYFKPRGFITNYWDFEKGLWFVTVTIGGVEYSANSTLLEYAFESVKQQTENVYEKKPEKSPVNSVPVRTLRHSLKRVEIKK